MPVADEHVFRDKVDRPVRIVHTGFPHPKAGLLSIQQPVAPDPQAAVVSCQVIPDLGHFALGDGEGQLLARLGESRFRWTSANVLRASGEPFPGVSTAEVLHAWRRPYSSVWREDAAVKRPQPDSHVYFRKAMLYPNGDLLAVYRWLADGAAFAERPYAVLGIDHPLALTPEPVELRPKDAYSLRGHSVGGYGSVTTNQLLAGVVADLFGLQVQAYPRYGSEKRGLPTTYYLTTAESPIRQHSELRRVEFVPLHDVAAFGQGAPLSGLVDGGTLFVNSTLDDPASIWAALPASARAEIIGRGIPVRGGRGLVFLAAFAESAGSAVVSATFAASARRRSP